METSDSNYTNTNQPLLVSTVLSTNVLQAKDSEQDVDQNDDGNEETTIEKDKLRRCKKCRKTFKNHATFLNHIKFHNTKNRRPSNKDQINNILFQQQDFQCKTCDTTCPGVSAFLEHMKTHTDQHEANYSPLQQQEVIVGNTTIQIPNMETDDGNAQRHVLDEQNLQLEHDVGTQDGNLQSGDLQDIPTTIYNNHPTQNNVMNMQSLQPNVPQPVTFQSSSNNGLHIEIPTHIKSLSFNSSNTQTATTTQLNDIMKTLQSLHNKVDVVIKHLNIPLDEDGQPIPPSNTTIEVTQPTHTNQDSNDNTEQEKAIDEADSETVLLEGFPPSYSIVQAAKEQQQQEFYALTLSNRQAQHLTQTSNEVKLLKGKGIDLWVPTSHQYILAETQPDEETATELTIPIPTTTSTTPTISIPNSIVDKIFVESRSRANFAKNLTFAIFTQDERRGRNCTGRVFGKAQHKGQLDPTKLNAVKEATFRKYPCTPNLMDITWRKECITAIDSGLRNEHRSTTMKSTVTVVSEDLNQPLQTHHHQLVSTNISHSLKGDTESQ